MKDHQQDIQETGDEVANGSSPEVMKDARHDLPVLRLHLKLAEQAARM